MGAYDILVVGGGVNGAGIARDAAGRGLSVLLVEQDDLAAHTSSLSTKLIHGGLRYLEYYEFRLVREALLERERLMAIAPHIVHPMRFVLPVDTKIRPAWMVRIGLFLYDHLARRNTLPGSVRIDLSRDPRGEPLKPGTKDGFEYSDCGVDDSRLVVLNALDARERGAQIRVGTRLESARREGGLWVATLADTASGAREEASARVLINAAGPWVAEVLNRRVGLATGKHVRLVKGSHFVTPRLFDGEHAYILQNPDKRIVFAIPYREQYTLIGTTDVPYEGSARDVAISAAETDYLVQSINHWFKRQIAPADVAWSYSGVRPLFDDGSISASAVTRDYVFDLDARDGEAPLLSVFGGKLTTYRKLAEHVMRDLARFLPGLKPTWTADAPLPGGDIPGGDMARFIDGVLREKPFLGRPLASRLARAYGTRVRKILGDAHSLEDLGRDFGGGLFQAELEYLRAEEWARASEDVLWRRTKLGLGAPAERAAAIDGFFRGADERALKSLKGLGPRPAS
jgi:glycerol-3-phosphate dehydrogenase